MSGAKTDEVQEARKAADEYAWNFFHYHAEQRQVVFRFFVTFVGLASAAYGYSLKSGDASSAQFMEQAKLIVGLIYIATSILFWRLDERSRRLVKLSETALMSVEDRLSLQLNDPTIKILHGADEKIASFPFSLLETFKHVYRTIFLLVFLAGLYLLLDYFGLLLRLKGLASLTIAA